MTGAHGLLPPWGRAPLPAPPAFTARNVVRTIGRGVIALVGCALFYGASTTVVLVATL